MMNSDPISKKQVYTERYGDVPAQNNNTEYDSFDISGVPNGPASNGINTEAYIDMASGEMGEGMGDSDLFSGMSEEDYIAHFQNNVAPQNQQEAAALMAQMDGQDEALFDPSKAIASLKAELQKSENSIFLDDETKDYFTGKIHDLEKLVGKKGTNPDQMQENIEGIQEELQSAIEENKGIRQEKISTMKGMVDKLLQDVERSRIPSNKKSELKTSLNALKNNLKNKDVNADDSQEAIDEIQSSFRKEKIIDELKDKLETLPSKIPGEGAHKEESAILASKIAEAVRNDDWSQVNEWLSFYRSNDTNKPNNFIPQVIGTIFMDLAGSDEDKLDALLSIIPEDTRNLMADIAPGDDPNSTENLNEPTKYKYYGRPNATADRLRSSRITESWNHLGEEEESATPS